MNIPEAFKRNKNIIKQNLNILGSYLTNKPTHEQIYIDKESFTVKEFQEPADGSKIETLLLDSPFVVHGDFEIKPVMLIKGYQRLYRDLTIVGFMNETNQQPILDFLSKYRFYTVIYQLRPLEKVVENLPVEKVVENLPVEEPLLKTVLVDEPLLTTVPVEEKWQKHKLDSPQPIEKMSYASAIKKPSSISRCSRTDTSSDEGRTDSDSNREYDCPHHKTTREYDNVMEYYDKFGDHRIYVLFQNTVNARCKDTVGHYRFSYEDKTLIRDLLNKLTQTNEKFDKIIRDNGYCYIKVIKTFHTDYSHTDRSIHFNIMFKSKHSQSDVYHIYTDKERLNVTRFSRTERFEL
jgi:hypothetical protein